MNFKTDQEKFWAGNFGNEYVARNNGHEIIASNINLFSKILSRTSNVSSIIEFGANIGCNLQAISHLLPDANLSAVEINENAIVQLKKNEKIKIYHSSILNFKPDVLHDISLIKGVLIHINPDNLSKVYELLYEACAKYICVAEYYNPVPVEVKYRGHEGKLFKRDFVGELMDMFPDLELIDYGFTYHRDNIFPQDDITWFLLKK